jgi:hypothetical protein
MRNGTMLGMKVRTRQTNARANMIRLATNGLASDEKLFENARKMTACAVKTKIPPNATRATK